MDSNDDLKNAFEQSQQKGNMKLTEEEAEKFKTAFEDPEFCKLMSDYVADLQNPEYRAETEAYIHQLESEDKVPQGKELIRPSKGFVAKSHKRDAKDKQDSKIFINIVHSDKITKPTKTDTAKGQNWSLPYSLGPPHMEKDKKEDAVVAFDCCFHPDAINMAHRYKAFRDLLVSTALQGIEEACKIQKQATTVRKEFTVLKGVSYKTGEVPTMMVDVASAENKWNSDMNEKQQKPEGDSSIARQEDVRADKEREEKSAYEMVTALEEAAISTVDSDGQSNKTDQKKKTAKAKAKPAVKKGFLNNSKNAGTLYPSGSTEGSRGVVPTKPLIEELPEGHVSSSPASTGTSQVKATETAPPLLTERKVKRKAIPETSQGESSTDNQDKSKVPKFTLVERGILGLGDFDGGTNSHRRKPVSTRPEELVYKIDIPLVKKTSKVELDVGEKELKMTYLDVYDLRIKLPYRVYEKKGGAKFDKGKKLLTITLPVQPVHPEDVILEDDDDDNVMTSDSAIQEVGSSSSGSEKGSVRDEQKRGRAPVHSRWVGDKEEDKKKDESVPRVTEVDDEDSHGDTETLAQEIQRKAREALALAETQKKVRPGTTAEVEKPAKKEDKSSLHLIGSESNCEEFIPSGTFVGSKKGYAFKKGESGVGYYADNGGKLIPQEKESIAVVSAIVPETEVKEIVPTAVKSTATSFPYQSRQTKEGIAMIVDVQDILVESVKITFQSTSVDVSFSSAASSSSSGEQCSNNYALGFDCMKELDCDACHYDVATQNMVIVLQKKVPEFWVSSPHPDDGSKPDIIISREYMNSRSSSSSSGISSSSSSSSSRSSDKGISEGGERRQEIAEVNAKALLSEMKFGSAGLLDLD